MIVADIARNRRLGYEIRLRSEDGRSRIGWQWFAFTERGARRKARRLVRRESFTLDWSEA